ncbi:ADP-ribose pyrophosphatase YjhB, NUDIX family [Pustulibacterium marinum]|uniref:ADP-ribose pyrophosphatase YjhB, NUDIX family n=1 Tax=Pustulibacterium marinum TaxID=1224947 RepID=A0A1I7HIH8_9FLAO|nr:NUDIX domain-containing protein [Pustulibacterium marinum]SFU60570.1 ADP-ribose pyrophosphatase YjhB, NUDIX family [Pustulibacterium marinum]
MINSYQDGDKFTLAVDCIIFGFDNEKLKILLIKRDFEPEKGKWSLMGGFLRKEENLDEAADRVLQHLTGLDNVYLEQLHAYSAVDRDPLERTVSVSYYALINASTTPEINDDGEQYAAHWFNIDEAPELIFDHNAMVRHAMNRLRYRALTKPIGFELLPEKFTMRQLQSLYEAILGEKLDKRNFINKINGLDILHKLDEKDMNSSRKGSFLYMFDELKYNAKVSEGFIFKL